MHALNDMSHEEMGLAQHYDDPHDYGLDAPANQPTFVEHEFYPSHAGLPMPDAKFQPQFTGAKSFLPRGLRFYGSWIEGMLFFHSPHRLPVPCCLPTPAPHPLVSVLSLC